MKAPTKIYAESAKKVAEIRRILCKDSTNVLAERLGITPQSASNLVHGYSGIGKTTADKILTAFPEISPEWLLAGEGPMLVVGDGSQPVIVENSQQGDNSQAIIGNGNHHNTNGRTDERLLAIIEQDQKERLELLAIIKNLTAK